MSVRNETMRIAGENVDNNRFIEVFNPYTEELVGTVPKATVENIKVAFQKAKEFKSDLSRHHRAEILTRAADLLVERRDEISDLITAEAGLCKKDTLYEVGRAYDVFKLSAKLVIQDDGQIFSCDISPHGKKRKIYTMRQPLLGVISAITPFNHPLNQVAHNFSVVTGDPKEIIDELLKNDHADLVTFTGGGSIGHHIAENIGYRRIILEARGNAALVVMEDADID